jgi:hypothetical protein
VAYRLHKLGLAHSRIFDRSGARLTLDDSAP